MLVDLDGPPVRGEGVVALPGLVQHHAALVPQLRGIGGLAEQCLVQLERGAEVALQEMHLRHRLQREAAVLTPLEREAVLAQRLGIVALLTECEPEVVVRQRVALDHLRHGGALVRLAALALRVVPLERKVRLRAREGRVELDGQFRRGARVLVAPQVAEHEGHQVVGVRVVGVELHGALQGRERVGVEAAAVVDLAQIEVDDARLRVALARVQEPFGGGIGPPPVLLRQRQLDHRGDVVGPVGEQLLELGRSVIVLAQNRIGAPELPAGVAVVGGLPQPLPQLRHPLVVVAGVVVGDLQVALRHLHLRVELERAGELSDRLLDQAFLVIEDAEVVVGPGVRRVDPAGEGSEDGEVAFRERRRRHESGQADGVEDRLE